MRNMLRFSAAALVIFAGVIAAVARDPGKSLAPWTVVPDALAVAATQSGAPGPAAPSADLTRIKPNLKISPRFKDYRQLLFPNRPSKYVITYGSELELWDLKRGEKEKTIKTRMGERLVMMSPDGKYVVSYGKSEGGGASDLQLQIWSIATATKICGLKAAEEQSGLMEPLGFVGADGFLVQEFTGANSSLQVRDVKTGEVRVKVQINEPIYSNYLAFSANGKYVAFDSFGGVLQVYDTATLKLAGEANFRDEQGEFFQLKALGFSLDGRGEIGVLETNDHALRLSAVNVMTGAVSRKSSGEFMTYLKMKDDLQYSPDGSAVLVAGNYVADRATLIPALKLPDHEKLLYQRWADSEHILLVYDLDGQMEFETVPALKSQIATGLADIANGGKIEDAGLTPATPVNYSGARKLKLADAPTTPWAVHLPEQEPVKVAMPKSFKVRISPPMPFPPGEYNIMYRNLSDKITATLFTSASARSMFIERSVAEPNPMKGKPFGRLISWMERYDLGGAMNAEFKVPASLGAIDASASGKSVLFRGGLTVDRLEVSSQDKGTFKPVAALRPFGTTEYPRWGGGQIDPNSVRWGAFLDETHVVAVSEGNRIACFEIPSAKVMWEVTPGSREQGEVSWSWRHPALSADRRLLTIPVKDGFVVLDALSGSPLNRISSPEKSQLLTSAFSPDGKQLAALFEYQGYSLVRVYDLATGTMTADFPVAAMPWDELAFVAPKYLLAGSVLISMEKKAAIWRYDVADYWKVTQGPIRPFERLFYLWQPPTARPALPMVVVNVDLPHAAAVKAGADLSTEDLFVFHPGMSVSFSATIVGDDAYQKEQMAEWMTKLKERGIEVDPNSPNKLQVTNMLMVSPGVQFDVQMITFGPTTPDQQRNPPKQTVTAHRYDAGYKISLTVDNKEVWKMEKTTPPQDLPGMGQFAPVVTKPGESAAQQAFDRANPPWTRASEVRVPPAYVLKDRKLGESKLGEKGVEDADGAGAAGGKGVTPGGKKGGGK